MRAGEPVFPPPPADDVDRNLIAHIETSIARAHARFKRASDAQSPMEWAVEEEARADEAGHAARGVDAALMAERWVVRTPLTAREIDACKRLGKMRYVRLNREVHAPSKDQARTAVVSVLRDHHGLYVAPDGSPEPLCAEATEHLVRAMGARDPVAAAQAVRDVLDECVGVSLVFSKRMRGFVAT